MLVPSANDMGAPAMAGGTVTAVLALFRFQGL
jgi:hypothetical protein